MSARGGAEFTHIAPHSGRWLPLGKAGPTSPDANASRLHSVMYQDTVLYMKQQRRLTRRESREATRAKLIEAAEKIFTRFGFEASSVKRIADAAGFSRGAFYSNFRDKDQLFIAVLNRRRLAISKALGEIFREEPLAGKRLRAVRDWYVHQGRQKQWIILETEFTLRAVRNRAVRIRLAALWRQELETYSALVARHFSEIGLPPVDKPETMAISLMAIVQGLGAWSLIETDRNAGGRFAEARNLVFNRLMATDEAATLAD
jgi:AcrR family transcriptional regulator